MFSVMIDEQPSEARVSSITREPLHQRHLSSMLSTCCEDVHSEGNDGLVSLENSFESLTMIIIRQATLYWTIFSRHVSCVAFGISRVT